MLQTCPVVKDWEIGRQVRESVVKSTRARTALPKFAFALDGKQPQGNGAGGHVHRGVSSEVATVTEASPL